jgi:hypothetical protein
MCLPVKLEHIAMVGVLESAFYRFMSASPPNRRHDGHRRRRPLLTDTVDKVACIDDVRVIP